MLHYTNKVGWDSIRSQDDWRFLASQPPGNNPKGAYFTTLRASTVNLAKRLRIPRTKIEFVFCFEKSDGLRSLPGGRGEYIWYSETDYIVEKGVPRQTGRTDQGVCN